MRDLGVKWGIFEEKMSDFCLNRVFFEEKMHDFGDKWGIFEEKMRDFCLNA